MHNFMLESGGIQTEPLHIALWGIPTAIFAFLIHAFRLYRMDKQLSAELARLEALKAVNPNIRDDEVEALEFNRRQVLANLNEAGWRLDAIRLVVVTHQ